MTMIHSNGISRVLQTGRQECFKQVGRYNTVDKLRMYEISFFYSSMASRLCQFEDGVSVLLKNH